MNRLGWHMAAQLPFGIGPILVYILLPMLDLRFGADGRNPPDELMAYLENDRYYRYCTYAYIPCQYAGVALGSYLFTPARSERAWLRSRGRGSLNWPAKIGLGLTVGALDGVGINTAHELGHKKEGLERWLSKITLAQSCYGHFYIEHNRGHHVRVATPGGPASGRFGETFWEFLPRSVFGGLRWVWRLEAADAPARQESVAPVQRRAQYVADGGGAVGDADRGVRSGVGLTYTPPVRRKLMDHRVLVHYGGDITRVNIDPRWRAKILARYAATETAAACWRATVARAVRYAKFDFELIRAQPRRRPCFNLSSRSRPCSAVQWFGHYRHTGVKPCELDIASYREFADEDRIHRSSPVTGLQGQAVGRG